MKENLDTKTKKVQWFLGREPKTHETMSFGQKRENNVNVEKFYENGNIALADGRRKMIWEQITAISVVHEDKKNYIWNF